MRQHRWGLAIAAISMACVSVVAGLPAISPPERPPEGRGGRAASHAGLEARRFGRGAMGRWSDGAAVNELIVLDLP